jgi:hypothetical protein
MPFAGEDSSLGAKQFTIFAIVSIGFANQSGGIK